MADKLDYKKEYRDLYLPKAKPALIEVPPMNFICVDGSGPPAGEAYQNAVQTLYALSFTIKMSKLSGSQPEGYFEYAVPPLEGLWWCAGGALDWSRPRAEWLWTSMIRQPEFVTPEVFDWALAQCRRKKPEVNLSGARLETLAEGLCVQMMHTGPYDTEEASLKQLKEFMEKERLSDCTGDVRKHHEIYLGDPRRTAPEKLKTVLRLPVARR